MKSAYAGRSSWPLPETPIRMTLSSPVSAASRAARSAPAIAWFDSDAGMIASERAKMAFLKCSQKILLGMGS